MLELKANYKSKYEDSRCELCNEEEDTTEHLFEYKKLIRLSRQKVSVNCLNEPNRDLSDYIRQAMWIRQWVMLNGAELGS